MGYDKGHKEFHAVDMKEGFHAVPGYPWGFSEKILAGSLDEKNKVGNRTRILKIEPGAFSTVPFVHEYWEEVFLVSGDLICGSDEQGQGRRAVHRPDLLRAPARRLSRPVHVEDRLPAAGDALLRGRSEPRGQVSADLAQCSSSSEPKPSILSSMPFWRSAHQ